MAREGRPTDWEAIEREFRAGQLSVREIGRSHGVTEGAIRKRAKAEGWERALASKVRDAVREKLVRADGTQAGTQSPHANDREIVEGASLRGLEVVQSHRRDIAQLTALSNVLATRLSQVLHNDPADGLCLGRLESPGDLLEKLTRVRAKLIPLERQAYNLDAGERDPSNMGSNDGSAIDLIARRLDRIASRNGSGGGAEGVEQAAG